MLQENKICATIFLRALNFKLNYMALTKSAKNAHRKSVRRKLQNSYKKKALKDVVKKVADLVSEKKVKDAQKLIPQVYKLLDKAAKTGIIKKNTASRQKSRISKSLIRAGK